MARFAIVWAEAPQFVSSVIEWYENEVPTPPEGYAMIADTERSAVPGGLYADGTFSWPPDLPPQEATQT